MTSTLSIVTESNWEYFMKDLKLLPKWKISGDVFTADGRPVDIIGLCDGSYSEYEGVQSTILLLYKFIVPCF